MYLIVMPQHGSDFYVESADATDKNIETSQNLETALKFENEADAAKYMEWVKTPYRIEPEELAVNPEAAFVVVIILGDLSLFFLQFRDSEKQELAICNEQYLAKRFISEERAVQYMGDADPEKYKVMPLAK